MAAKIGGGTLHSVPPGPKIWGGTCLRASMASPPMDFPWPVPNLWLAGDHFVG